MYGAVSLVLCVFNQGDGGDEGDIGEPGPPGLNVNKLLQSIPSSLLFEYSGCHIVCS